jgi:hypothetical protein
MALVLTDLPVLPGLLGVALAALILFRDHARAARRPTRMRLYADGSVECQVTCRRALARDVSGSRASALLQVRQEESRASALLQTNDALMQPATLLQATSFLGLMQLRWADASDAHHACVLFPDRLDAGTRHRLRVWLATHRPSRAPFPVPRAPRAAASAP